MLEFLNLLLVIMGQDRYAPWRCDDRSYLVRLLMGGAKALLVHLLV